MTITVENTPTRAMVEEVTVVNSAQMTITVESPLTRATVEQAMVVNNAQMTIMVETALKRVTAEAVVNDFQILLMTPLAAMAHNAAMTILLTVAVVLAARDLHMEVRDPTTTAGTVVRNDKMMLSTTAILVVPMEDMDKLVSEHRPEDTTHPMVNLISQAMEAASMAGTKTTTAKNPGAATMTTTTKVISPTNPAMGEVMEGVMEEVTTVGVRRAMAAVMVEETTTAVMGGRETMILMTTRKSSNQTNPVTAGVGKTKMTPTMTIASIPARNTTTMTGVVMVNKVMVNQVMANPVIANPVDMPRAMVGMKPLV